MRLTVLSGSLFPAKLFALAGKQLTRGRTLAVVMLAAFALIISGCSSTATSSVPGGSSSLTATPGGHSGATSTPGGSGSGGGGTPTPTTSPPNRALAWYQYDSSHVP
ncbi:MAG TPA: hypothetical protein VKQ36_08995, partial [Ktedonobacterales bacterium]|nr:hypothetical protein [Ktedonobacterales bacterium]